MLSHPNHRTRTLATAVVIVAMLIFALMAVNVEAQTDAVPATAVPSLVPPTLAPVVTSVPATVAPFDPDVRVAPVTPIDRTPEVAVLPNTLERLSWGAIAAGTIIVLILMFLFNLIGLAIGMTTLNPNTDSPDGGTMATTSIVWVLVSNLLALFIGGWVAGYFAGIPSNTDGLLHGIMTWGVSGIITALLVVTGIGRLVSGVTHLLGSTLSLAGSVTGSVAQGAANIVGGVVGGAGNLVGSAVGGAGNVAANALGTLARGAQETAAVSAQGFSHLTDSALENAPEIKDALNLQDLTRQDIEYQARRLLQNAGVNTEGVQSQVEGAVADARGMAEGAVQDVRDAAQQVMRDPGHAGQYLGLAIQRVFRRGEEAIDQVDRDALIETLTENSGMDRAQIEEQIAKWEGQFNRTKEAAVQARDRAVKRVETLRDQAEQKAQALYEQAQQKAQELQHEAEARFNEARAEAERVAREAGEKAAKGLALAAGALAISMVLGLVAAGLGGLIGAPDSIPSAEIEAQNTYYVPSVERISAHIEVAGFTLRD